LLSTLRRRITAWFAMRELTAEERAILSEALGLRRGSAARSASIAASQPTGTSSIRLMPTVSSSCSVRGSVQEEALQRGL